MKPDDLIRAARKAGLAIESRGVNADAIGEPALDASSERAFQDSIATYARSRGWRCMWFRTVRVQRADGSVYFATPVGGDAKGFLDLELLRERLVKIEAKMPGRKMTPEQEELLSMYRDAGIEAYCFWPKNWDEILRVLK